MGGHIDAVEILSMNVSCNMAILLCIYQADLAQPGTSGKVNKYKIRLVVIEKLAIFTV